VIDETRKAIRWGRSKTLVVSLPRRWTKKYSIEPDTHLHLQEAPDGSLRIIPFKMLGPPKERETTIRLVEQDELTLTTLLENYFIDGYDQLILECPRRFREYERNMIIKVVNQLPGFEIIETTDRKIIIKDVIGIRADDILEFVKMSSRTTLELLSKIIEGLSSGPDETELAAKDIITDAWRQRGNYLRVQRELRKALSSPQSRLKLAASDIFDTAYYILQLSNIHENIQHIAEALIRRQPPSNQVKIGVAALKKVRDNLKNAISAFLQKNQEMVHQVLGETPLLREWKRQTETIVDVMEDSVITQILLDACEIILAYNREIAKTALLHKTAHSL